MTAREDFDRCVAQLADPARARPAYWQLVAGGPAALASVRAGLGHESGAVRAQCAEALDRLVDEESYPLLVACLADPEPRVRVNALHALACDRCKQSAACRPDKASVLPPAVRCLRQDPDKHVRAMAVAVVGRWVHSDETAAAALVEARDLDPEPLVRKSAGWYCPGGPIHRRTAPG
ncbi:MAG TPA: HEAT repeat domain-containing protein [Acidimicrobiales bacterium]